MHSRLRPRCGQSQRRKLSEPTMDTMLGRERALGTIPPSTQGPSKKKNDLIARGNGGRVVCRDGAVNSTTFPVSAARSVRGISLKRRRDTLEDENPRRLRDRSAVRVYTCVHLRSVPLTDLASRIASVTYIRGARGATKRIPFSGPRVRMRVYG